MVFLVVVSVRGYSLVLIIEIVELKVLLAVKSVQNVPGDFVSVDLVFSYMIVFSFDESGEPATLTFDFQKFVIKVDKRGRALLIPSGLKTTRSLTAWHF